tara:strand:- start:31163 stop:32119 length:957 start_codon:yes stop_codon:yes gene_type:complete
MCAAIAAITVTGGAASAQEVQLQAASCFPEGSFFSQRFEALVEEINTRGAGKVNINYVGGAPAIGSNLTVVQKVSQGVFDINSCTGSYYQNVVPEADAWKLLERTPTEVRENGGWDFMNEIHHKKNLHVLSRHHFGTKFHLFLGEGQAIDKPDLTGLHLRVAATYTNFFKQLGATTQDANVQQIYPLMEAGTVKGYGWPILGHQPGWETVTKYRVDPGFYDVDLVTLINNDVWESLPDDVAELIASVSLAQELEAIENDAGMNGAAGDKQVENGFEVIEFTGDDADYWLANARSAGWEGMIANSPETGPRLREYFAIE